MIRFPAARPGDRRRCSGYHDRRFTTRRAKAQTQPIQLVPQLTVFENSVRSIFIRANGQAAYDSAFRKPPANVDEPD